MRRASLSVIGFVASAACGGGTSAVDAGPGDAVADAGPRPDGACGEDAFITGELLDFDSSAAAFAGVAGATLQPAGGASVTTPPNGRFELCASGGPTVLVTVDAPDDRLDGVAYIEARPQSVRPPSLRSLTPARAASFYQEHGLTFDATKAHVLVFLAGDQSEITLDRAHATVIAGDEATGGTVTWGAGNVGRYVLFPNVDVASPTATLTGDIEGPHTLPIAAGKLTWVHVSWFFL